MSEPSAAWDGLAERWGLSGLELIGQAHVLADADLGMSWNTLYIARSVTNEVDTVHLSCDATRATVVSTLTYPGADTTTGVAVSGNRLLVTNSQTDTYLYGDPLTSPVFTLESLPPR
ncbi:hypothetical protein [Streptomyces thermodiastaticus]|jgi:hypothetical protein|uniref:hypothetical protein n=1 Tax=Streptomyces thermodiastaticus TaxID=44061 RepID=UPI00167A19F8|nr:hypothetical protein [Streptomyces thermodiastaticus]MCE7551962.1 hypothetical protein [Streptomyces thermodiastaticus]GHE24381.1 hypothetical protein GCM10018787_54190 [Streptomyces thermodiastaticus]